MVATMSDVVNHPDVCGVVYKLTATTTHNNENNNSINNNNGINDRSVTTSNSNNHGDVVWKEFARLTTKDDPMTGDIFQQSQAAVSIQDQTIFTGRYDSRDEGVGKVFVHDLSKYNK